MKQEIVIKIAMHTDKKRTAAMKIVVSMPGVAYAELHGDGMNQIKVKGDGVDSVCLTKLLRKNVGYAELVSVTPIKPKTTPVFNPCFGYPYFTPPPPIYLHQVPEYNSGGCTIM